MMQLPEQRAHPSQSRPADLAHSVRRHADKSHFHIRSYEKKDLLPAEVQQRHRWWSEASRGEGEVRDQRPI